MKEDWKIIFQDYLLTIDMANPEDLIYCDPPYLGRYTDYYNNWTDKEEAKLFEALKKTKAKFILSSWHHNQYRENLAIKRLLEKNLISLQEIIFIILELKKKTEIQSWKH